MSGKEKPTAAVRARPARSPRGRPPQSPRSPGRPPKSPSRKSPSRKNPEPRRKSKSPSRATPLKKSPSRIPRFEAEPPSPRVPTSSTPIPDLDTDGSDAESKIPRPSGKVRGRPRTSAGKRDSATPIIRRSEGAEYELTSRVTRSSVSKEIIKTIADRVVHLKSDFLSKKDNSMEFSDEDEIPIKTRIDLKEKIAILRPSLEFRTEFGGMWTILVLLFALPIFTIAIVENTITKNWPNFTQISTYYDTKSYVILSLFLLLNFILSLIPFGSRPEGQLKVLSTSNFYANGFIHFFISLFVLIGLHIYNFPIVHYIDNHFLEITSAGILLSIVFSILLFVKSYYVPVSTLNRMGDTDSFIYNLFVGREVAPIAFGSVHLKIYLLRVAYIGRALLTLTVILKALDTNKLVFLLGNMEQIRFFEPNLTLIVACGMVLTVAFDRIVLFEKTAAATFELRYEGHGYLSNVYFASTVFLYGLIPKRVHDDKVQLNPYVLGAMGVTFMFGYLINRLSSNQKYAFRVNPFGPKVSSLSSVLTSHGKKLLSGSFWGVVRHPNYFGELLMILSYLPLVWGTPLALYLVLSVLAMVYRTNRVEYVAKQRYETGWDRYCQSVKERIIPKVF